MFLKSPQVVFQVLCFLELPVRVRESEKIIFYVEKRGDLEF